MCFDPIAERKLRHSTPKKNRYFEECGKDFNAEVRNFSFKLLSKSCGAFQGPELVLASIPSTFPIMHAYLILFLNIYTSAGPQAIAVHPSIHPTTNRG